MGFLVIIMMCGDGSSWYVKMVFFMVCGDGSSWCVEMAMSRGLMGFLVKMCFIISFDMLSLV